jgi:16S rRNA (cytosine1402-N4)-methyltransferase
VDCTFGRGGHSRAILAQLSEDGRLLAIDRDVDAVSSEAAKALSVDKRFRIEHGRFGELGTLLKRVGWDRQVSGILIDLGVSSPQLDQGERGFSFMRDGPLDMRMDRTRGITAAEWLMTVTEGELGRILKEYGEEKYARRIARSIVDRRGDEALVSTAQLAALISAGIPRWEQGKHPATRSFQAIRMCINEELRELQSGLVESVEALVAGGRLVVIAFHSLEDRMVKRFIRDECRGGPELNSRRPLPSAVPTPRLRRLGRAIKPSDSEVRENPRSRSAVLRVAEKLSA